jgi:pseudouridine kinase
MAPVDDRVNAAGAYVVVIGDAAMDIAVTASVSLPKCGGSCQGSAVRYQAGGCARNVAENLARLGCRTYLLSVFGDDEAGQVLQTATQQAGVDLSASLCSGERPSTHCVVVNDYDGEPFCCVSDVANVALLTPAFLHGQHCLLKNAALIVANSALSEETLAWLFTHYSDKPLFIDLICASQSQRLRPWLAQIHSLRLSRDKASALSGLPLAEDVSAVAHWFLAAGVQQVIISQGAQGSYYTDGVFMGWLQRRPVKVVNVTGAGDALSAGLAYGELHGMQLVETLRFALGCSALTLTTLENNYAELSPAAVREVMLW